MTLTHYYGTDYSITVKSQENCANSREKKKTGNMFHFKLCLLLGIYSVYASSDKTQPNDMIFVTKEESVEGGGIDVNSLVSIKWVRKKD